VGVQDPWLRGPLSFTSTGGRASFWRRRSAELKHGRISVRATVGSIMPEMTNSFLGYLSPSAGLECAGFPNSLAALTRCLLGWAQIVAYAGFCELSAGSNPWSTGTRGEFPRCGPVLA